MMLKAMDFLSGKTITRFCLILSLTISCGTFNVTEAQNYDNAYNNLLTFLTWSEYLDPEIVSEFEQRFNAKIDFVYYDSDSARAEMLVAHDGRGYDLVLTNGPDIQKYYKRGWLAPVSTAAIPNLVHIESRWADAFPIASSHAVPYFWGVLGIAYRQDLVPQPITSWKQLLHPAESLRGKIIMNRYSRDLTAIALRTLGYSINSNDLMQLQEAGDLLQAQRPYVKHYGYISLSEQSALVSGDAWVSMIYNGDVLMLSQNHDEIKYVFPEEGSNIWVDYLAILNHSAKKELAAAFINFLNEPVIAARNAEFVYYATPNQTAKAHLPREYFENPVIYPSADCLARSEFYRPLNPRAQKKTNMLMAMLLQAQATK